MGQFAVEARGVVKRYGAVSRQLVCAGLEVSEVRMTRRSLQEVFLKLTGGRTGGADSVRRRTKGG